MNYLFTEVNFTQALRKVIGISLLVGLYSFFVYFFLLNKYTYSRQSLSYFESIFTIILGLLLVFRSNRAYERWWEARILWGQLVNASRNLAIKINVLLEPNLQEALLFSDLINHFCEALAIHLRQKNTTDDFDKILHPPPVAKHIPSYLAKELYTSLCQHPKAQQGLNLWILDEQFTEFMKICGGCERIKNTFISLSFRVFVKHVFFLFILVIPWSLIPVLGVWSIPATILICYLIIAIEGIARNLEEPFGLTEDHLNLTAITNNIKVSVNEILLT